MSGAEKTLGEDHVVTLDYMRNLGVYVQLGKTSEAEAAYKRVLTGRKKMLDEHELILDVIHDLEIPYVAQGREAEAEESLYRAWTVERRCLGRNMTTPTSLLSTHTISGFLKGGMPSRTL